MRKLLLAILFISAFALPASSQTTRNVVLAWDAPAAADLGVWKEVRIYEIMPDATYQQRGFVTCMTVTPFTCPTTITFTADKTRHVYIARSSDGSLESDDSNQVVVTGAPNPPKNVRRGP